MDRGRLKETANVLLACRSVQCLADGGLVAVITERVRPTADVGRLAAGDRVVRSCRRACPAQALVCRSGRGLPRVVVCSGEAGSARRGCWRGLSRRRNPWGADALGAVAGAGRVRHRTGYGSSYSGPTRSHPCRCGRQAGSDPKRAAPLSHLLPRARLPTSVR